MRVHLPIDTSALMFFDTVPPEPLLDRQTKQQRADDNGEPLNTIEVTCIVAGGSGKAGGEIVSVRFPGALPAGIRPGTPVKLTGLTVTDYTVEGRFGLTFRAARVESLNGSGSSGSKAGAA